LSLVAAGGGVVRGRVWQTQRHDGLPSLACASHTIRRVREMHLEAMSHCMLVTHTRSSRAAAASLCDVAEHSPYWWRCACPLSMAPRPAVAARSRRAFMRPSPTHHHVRCTDLRPRCSPPSMTASACASLQSACALSRVSMCPAASRLVMHRQTHADENSFGGMLGAPELVRQCFAGAAKTGSTSGAAGILGSRASRAAAVACDLVPVLHGDREYGIDRDGPRGDLQYRRLP